MLQQKKIMFTEESEKSAAFYRKMLKWLDNSKRNKYNNPAKLVGKAGIHEGHEVLEIGCGSGFFTEEIAKLAGKTGKVIATDIHPMAVKETAKKVAYLGLSNVAVHCEDAQHTSFADNSFDVIILYGVIPAPVISLKELSKEMHRILKPNGICAIWTAMPLWRPIAIQKHADFVNMKRLYPVFRLQKIAEEKR